MDLFAGTGQQGQATLESSGFSFDPQRTLQRRLKEEQQEASEHFPQEFVSDIVKAGSSAGARNSCSPHHLQQMAEAALGVEKLKEEKTRAVQLLSSAQAKIKRLEAERREMHVFYEQQKALVEEQEEVTREMLRERADLDGELESLVSQRSGIASDRAQLIIEISRADAVKADLEVQRMDLEKRRLELEEALVGFESAKAQHIRSEGSEFCLIQEFRFERANVCLQQLSRSANTCHSMLYSKTAHASSAEEEHLVKCDKNGEITQAEQNFMQDKEREAELSFQEKELEAASKDLDFQQARMNASQLSAERLMEQLVAKSESLDAQQEELEREEDLLASERATVQDLIHQLRIKREELDAEHEVVNQRWATLDREEARLSRERKQLDEQLTHLADEWAEIKAERSRLECLDGRLVDREAALQRREEPAEDPFTPKPVKGAALYSRQSIAGRGDSPRDVELWRTPLLDEQGRLDIASCSHEVGSEIDSLDGPNFIADSAASMDGLGLCKERAALLKDERMRLWALYGNPEELEKASRQLHNKEAQLAFREMRLEAREAVQNEQDRRVEAEEMVREWALSLREGDIATKEQELLKAEAKIEQRTEQAWELRDTVKQLKDQLVMAMEQCASSEKALRYATRKRRSWTKPADDSVLTSLKARGLDMEDIQFDSKLFTA